MSVLQKPGDPSGFCDRRMRAGERLADGSSAWCRGHTFFKKGFETMLRTFQTHQIRDQKELSDSLWEFSPCQGERAGCWRKAAVPGCWENYPGFEAYRGEGMFRKKIHAGGNVRLEFKGVSHTAEIFLDGKKIASHYNAYTPFDVVVPDLEQGEHLLEVKADNRFGPESALHVPNDYMSYGGISRAVAMETVPDVYLQWVHVTPRRSAAGWQAEVEVCLKNLTDQEQAVEVSASLAGKTVRWKGCPVAAAGETVLKETACFSEISQWSPENPALYSVTAQLLKNQEPVDDLIDRFGFREVKVEGKRVLLNGREILIKGFCRHEDHPQFGCALPFSAMAADLALMRDMGANSVRTSHYPNDEIFLDLCDEQGILVWEENHARGLELAQMQNPNFQRQALDCIREMITAHYNHPCIYIWGILNECASETEYGKSCYAEQFELIRSLDSSRPRSFASCRFKNDICLGLPEVVSYNIYPQWYNDAPVEEYLDELYRWIQEDTEGSGKPFLVTEIGAGGIYGYRTPAKCKWSEEYQAQALQKQLTAVLNYPGCFGVYIWQFCDVRISEEWFYARPRTMNNKGIVDEYRRPKLACEVVKRIFSECGNKV